MKTISTFDWNYESKDHDFIGKSYQLRKYNCYIRVKKYRFKGKEQSKLKIKKI